MEKHFDPYDRHYASLSVKDLLDAREVCHFQFSHSSNVYATAIGLYRIRIDDPDGRQYTPTKLAAKKRGKLGARTFENTVIRPWSWPCVLVFVREWLSAKELHEHPDHAIPPFLYLSDGRVVPVCTVAGSVTDRCPAQATGSLTFSSNVIGGGYPVLTDVQGKEHTGSVACLVTDGDRYYALTNQHVAGSPGREVYTVVKGQRTRVGVADDSALRKAPFTSIYPGFAGANTQSNLDIGLIDVDDVAIWTAQIFGLGVLGPIISFDHYNASLDWIGVPVIAHGAAGGCLKGEIKALFYRYGTLNGTDYVSDFLIGGRADQPLTTAPGDSGTLWCVDPTVFGEQPANGAKPQKQGDKNQKAPRGAEMVLRYRPLAIQWGGQKLSANGGVQYTQYALASAASVACRQLDVEIVTDLNAEHPQYWGAVGHYKIAEIAIGLVSDKQLKNFMKANLAQLTYDAETIATGDIPHDASQFVPLADVPDIVWKTNMNRGAAAARPQENWNHYADMDLPGEDGGTLDDLCGPEPKVILEDWINFYKNAPVPSESRSRSNNMGSLPFRVWQIFEAMAKYRGDGDAARFLCAAGIVSHYIGDACQPLHSSMHSDGLNGAATGVHSTYEEKMIDRFAEELRQRLDQFDMSQLGDNIEPAGSGYEAAQASIRLMRRTHQRLAPEHICEVYNDLGGGQGQAVVTGLWNQLADQTVACIADGARTLAMIWNSAYAASGGPAFSGTITGNKLRGVYEKQNFLPSLHLANLDRSDFEPPQ
ncbi:MAG TPA: S1/P1 Nuclease [Blastocatellia bacterium]|nr:S1/P1 Nuclease [Blastocatellia bacterium]